MATTVVNIRHSQYEVYIGRAGHGMDGYFGNPFRIGPDGDRVAVLKKYKAWFWKRVNEDPEFRRRIMELKDQRLGCFCHPQLCHGDVIKAYIDAGCPTRNEPKV